MAAGTQTAKTTREMDLRRLRWFLFATAAVAAILAIAAPSIQAATYLIYAIATVVLLTSRVRHLPDDSRRVTTLPIASIWLAVAAIVIRTAQALLNRGEIPFPSAADAVHLTAYGVMAVAMLRIARSRVHRLTLDPILDASVGGIALGLLQGSLLLRYLDFGAISSAAMKVNAAYNVMVWVLAVVAILALVAGSTPSTSNRLLAAALISLVISDVTATFVTAGQLAPIFQDLTAPIPLVLGACGILHPSIIHIVDRPTDPGRYRRLTRRRVTVLAVALLTPPVLMVTAVLELGLHGVALLAPATSLVLAPLVVIRLGRLVRQNERMAAQEATLRSVGERLVGAESEEDVCHVITVGLEQLLGDRLVEGALVPLPARLSGSDDEPFSRAVRHAAGLLHRDARDAEARTGNLHSITSDGLPGQWLAASIVVLRATRALLVFRVSSDVSDDETSTLHALCREASIALRAVEQTEQTVRQRSEDRFGALIDNSSDIVSILTEEGTFSYISPVASRLLGYPLTEGTTPVALDLVHPDDREIAERVLGDIRFGQRSPVELRLRHADGSYVWFEVVGVDLQSDPNIRGLVLNAREIGDRKAAEERLRLSEARFKALVQNSSDVVLVVGSAGGIRYASPAVISTIGVEPDELTDRSLNEVFRDSGVDWDGALRGVRAPGEHPELLEFGFRNERGDWIHLEASVTDLRREEAVGGFVLNARDVTERTAMMQRLRYQSTHDALTGLPNRVLATEELGGMLDRNAGGSTVAIISLDIDDFKDINDSLGHGVGDRLLYSVAERIKESLAFGDVAARAGGDEFVVVLERAHGEAQVLELADRLLTSMEHPFDVDGRELSITASAGVAFDHDRETAAEVLLRNADTAMYRAKQLGKRQSVVFEPHMHTASFDRLELRADLVRAIETDQFMAHYQPIVDLETHRIVGCEALIRWQHPNRGLLSPAIFVPLAEETGLIGAMGEWMLERACRDLSGWRAEMPQVADALTISVNLTAQEVHGERLVPVVTDILRRTGLPADRLVLEVTESNLLSDTDVIQERMQRLRELGTRLAIDDFGTGYSSLGYIQRFAFDVLKIDRSFVEGLDRQTNRQIVTAVLDLARELGVRVVAKGIEEQDQEQALIDLGCKFAQGYRFSRPVPETAFRKLLVEQAVSVPS